MDKAKSEVLRYLGHRNQNVPAELDATVGECMALIRDSAVFRHIGLTLDILTGDALCLAGTDLRLHGKDISRHLHGCGKAVLFAATLGAKADALIQKWERADITRAVVLDACATQLIEECCDRIEDETAAESAASGLAATRRFSPGYGDFPLDVQPQILAVLNAGRRIGLTCTENFIMLPRKSVTALIGIGKPHIAALGGCRGCDMRYTCAYQAAHGRNKAEGCQIVADNPQKF